MNKQRRQELYDVTSILDDAIDRLEEIRDDEQESFDSLPDSLQNSSRGNNMLSAMDELEGFVDKIDGVKGAIEGFVKGK